jgi:16S rRNA (guanine527-N7)-methyltransferase
MSVVDALNLGAEAQDKLRLFQDLVEKWNPRINLVAKSTIGDLWQRHIEDSAFLCQDMPEPAIWADLGAGGGFPGLVVAVVLQDRGAQTRVVLVESDQRKATFLREAARHMALPVEVRAERIETLAPLKAGVISARALAPLERLCAFAEPHLTADGLCLFPKGERFGEEIAEARQKWLFDLETRQNPGHKGSALLILRNIRRV